MLPLGLYRHLSAWLFIARAAQLFCSPAWAQPPDASELAITKAAEGKAQFEAEAYDAALALFLEADALYHSPVLVLYAARSERELGKLVAARSRFRALVTEAIADSAPESWREAQRDAKAELEALEPQIPQLSIVVTGEAAGAIATVDDTPRVIGAPFPIDPGAHEVTVTRGEQQITKTVTVAAGAKEQVTFDLVALAPPPTPLPPPHRRPLPLHRPEPREGLNVPALVVTLVGGAAIAAGLVVGGFALSKASAAADAVPASCDEDRTCPSFERTGIDAAYDSASTLGAVSDGLWIGGAVVAAVGIVLWIVDPSAPAKIESGSLQLSF